MYVHVLLADALLYQLYSYHGTMGLVLMLFLIYFK